MKEEQQEVKGREGGEEARNENDTEEEEEGEGRGGEGGISNESSGIRSRIEREEEGEKKKMR